ncbi:DUF4231 domain-containing protein [Micromonospora taraxaci]|nr:DUF4231 domain-containing protein [Micromonospora taraxaci]
MPGIYRASDRASETGQRSYMRWSLMRLASIVVAAITGTVSASSKDNRNAFLLFGILAVIAFISALVVEILLLTFRPEEAWYHGRAVAESVKTLTWSYVMQADPFGPNQSNLDADRLFLQRIREVLGGIPAGTRVEASAGAEITSKMRALRRYSFDRRKQLYLAERVTGQLEWYARRAAWNEKRAKVWRAVLLALEASGGALAVCQVAQLLDLNAEALIASIVAAIGAWFGIKQFDNLSNAYALTATELSLVKADGLSVANSESWSEYVRRAEQAISREHTMWLARRVQPRLAE